MSRFPKNPLAEKWLLPITDGIEIGRAAHNPMAEHFPNVAPAEQEEFYADEQRKLGNDPSKVDVYAEGDDLPFAANSLGAVASSHVIEHLPDPLGALLEWHRVLRPGGICFVICPHRDALPEDRTLPVTTTAHLVADFDAAHTADTHPTDEVPGGRRGHYHRWTPESFREMIQALNAFGGGPYYEVVDHAERCHVGNGFVFVLRVIKK
jgi:SAM-dependent methyltransferase